LYTHDVATRRRTSRLEAARRVVIDASDVRRDLAPAGLAGPRAYCTVMTTVATDIPTARTRGVREPSAPATLDLEPREGSRIGRFLVLAKIGEGGLGRVYAAHDPKLDRRVAIKLVKTPAGVPDSARYRDLLQKEAQAMAKLSHPNVVAVYDVGVYAGDVFVAMEYVEGVTLRRWAREGAPRRWREVRDVFVQAGRGLAAAHAVGIVHRDFKPENVLLGADGRVRVLDFGLAREVVDRDGSAAKTTQGEAHLGTPQYMSPEQFTQARSSALSDQFSFCVSLYEVLYGQRPFAGTNYFELSSTIVQGKVRPVPAGRGAPKWLHRVVLRGLSTAPAQRYPGMDALLRDLAREPLLRVRQALGVALLAAAATAAVLSAREWTRRGAVEVRVTAVGGAAVRGVRVFVDGAPLPVAADGARGEVDPGLHRIRAWAPDHVAEEVIVDVQRGGSHALSVALAHERGLVDLDVEPRDAVVELDGEDIGSRLRRAPIDTGRHHVRVRRAGHYDVERTWDVRVGETLRDHVDLPRALGWSKLQTGKILDPVPVGDLTGDGATEILHGSGGVLVLSDPLAGVDLWRASLGPHESSFATAPLDAVAGADVVAARFVAQRWQLVAWPGVPDPEGRREPLWAEDGLPAHAGPPLLVAADLDGEPGAEVVSDVLRPGKLSARRGGDGRKLWELALPGPALALALARAPAGPRLFVETARAVLAVDARTGKQRWRRKTGPRRPPGPGALSVAVPLDAAAGDDLLLVRGEPALVEAWPGAGGAPLWSFTPQGRLVGDAGVADVDGDGAREVALTIDDAGARALVLLDPASGTPRWAQPLPGDAAGCGLLATRGDDAPPHVCEAGASGVRLRDPRSGAVVAEFAAEGPARGRVAVLDWDLDGARDVAFGTLAGVVQVHDLRGERLAKVFLDERVRGLRELGDLDGDGAPDLLAGANGPMIVRGPKVRWTRKARDALRAAPIVHDADGDGRLEVTAVGAFEGSAGALVQWDAGTGVERDVRAAVGDIIRTPTTWSGPDGELLAAVSSDRLVVWRARDLSVVAERPLGLAYASPALGDLDGDGAPELVVLPWSAEHPLTVLRAGDLAPLWTLALADGGWATPQVADLDGQPGPELLVALHDGQLLAVDPRARAVRWRRNVGGRLVHPPTLVDLDGDGAPELLTQAAADGQDLLCLRARDGEPLWRAAGLGSPQGRVWTHTPRGPGGPRLLVATAARGALGLSARGEPVWTHPAGQLGGPPLRADLDGDGASEFLLGTEDGVLHVLDAETGAARWRFRTDGGERLEAPPVAADLDGDGRAEVLVSGHDRRLYVLGTPPARTRGIVVDVPVLADVAAPTQPAKTRAKRAKKKKSKRRRA
jgi:outer membrane protein assembly factor BamB/predicted Ser/Thr protein kinase